MNIEWDDVLIVGDSFCAVRDREEHWPQHLTCKLTNLAFDQHRIPRGRGFGGCSWWSVRKSLLSELTIKVPKVLIICHTDPSRIPSDYDLPLNSSSISDSFLYNEAKKIRRSVSNIITAARLYLAHLISYEFHEWSQIQWYKELDQIIGDNNIPYVIHMHFPEHNNQPGGKLYKFDNGVTIEQPLWNLVSEDLVQSNVPNHFTLEENVKLANCLYDIIEQYPGNTIVKLVW